jgi:hypothetical protein
MPSSADAPGSVLPEPENGHDDGQAARPGGRKDDAVSSRTRRRRLIRNVTVIAAAAAVAVGVVVAVVGNPAPAPSGADTGGAAAARPAVLAHEAAADVAVVKTSGSIIGGPVLSKDGQLWLVEASRGTGQPVLAAVDPATYAVSVHPLPASLDGLSLRYTGAEAFDNVGQLWLGATAAAAGQQPAGMLVRYLLGSGTITHYPLAGTCGDDPTAQPAQLFSASDGGVWVECPSPDSAATAIVRLQRDGTFIQPYIVNYLNRNLVGTSLGNEIANLPQASIGPLAPVVGGTMWGMTAGGFVQFTAVGAETYTPVSLDATELTTQALLQAQVFRLAGNSQSLVVGGVGECRPVDAPDSQARECAISVDSGGGETVLAAAPDYDGQVGNANVHPAGMDASGDLWFIVDGTAGGKAPAGQYFFEATSGGGSRIIPFTVPGDTRPIPVAQAPVITRDGAVWTVDPAAGPGTLVELMPKI